MLYSSIILASKLDDVLPFMDCRMLDTQFSFFITFGRQSVNKTYNYIMLVWQTTQSISTDNENHNTPSKLIKMFLTYSLQKYIAPIDIIP